MIPVGAGLDHHVDNAALEVAELRGRVVGDHLEFLNRIQVRLVGREVVGHLIVIDAVEQEIVRLFAVAVHVWTSAASAPDAVVETGGIGRGNPGRQQRKSHRIAADQRGVYDGVGVDHRPDLRAVGLQDRRVGAYGDAFGKRPHRHHHIHAGALVQFQNQARIAIHFETGRLHAEIVASHRDAGESVNAVGIASGGKFNAAVHILGGHRRVGDGRPRGIGNPAGDAGADFLRGQRQRE